MDIINLNLEKLNRLDLTNTSSTEGGLYTFEFESDKKVVKELDFIGTPYYNNKLKIVLSLNNLKNVLPEELCVPEGLIEYGGIISGFYLPFINGKTLKAILSSKDISHNTKIMYLKSVGKLLEKLKNTNLYLNDLHEDNFIITDKENINPLNLLDTITEKQFYKTRRLRK